MISEKIKKKAKELGFLACGIASVRKLHEEEAHLSDWLSNGYQASMEWMNNHFEKRLNPALLVENSKSVITVLLNYFPENIQSDSSAPIISKYAYGKDYHFVMKDKLKLLYEFINNEISPIEGRMFVDSAPVMERAWAVQAGLGWIGKNSLLINNNHGSFFFIGELIIDLELEYDKAFPADFCGSCTRCIDACPTQAIIAPRVVDSNKCISYWTIEHKGDIDENLKGTFENRVFGCDICQDVCPWNQKKAKAHTEDEFIPKPELLALEREGWEKLDEKTFQTVFQKSAVKRAKFKGLKRNIKFLRE
jgi:epoxyqueuosine reductase